MAGPSSRAMKRWKLIVALFLVALIGIVVIQNREPVETHILFKTIVMSHSALLFLTAWIGFVAGILMGLFVAKKTGTKK